MLKVSIENLINEYAEKILLEINCGLSDTCSATFEELDLVFNIKTGCDKAELEENLRAQNFAELSDKLTSLTYRQY